MTRETMKRVLPGDHYVTDRPDEVIVTVLGSCVAACIRDKAAGVGGLNHFMLPESASGDWGAASAHLRFGNFAMERLINDILCRGGRRARLEIKVFGGAAMMSKGPQVGLQNAAFVEEYLRKEGLSSVAADLRGSHARRVHYYPLSGRARVLALPRVDPVIAIENQYRQTLPQSSGAGSIDLFD